MSVAHGLTHAQDKFEKKGTKVSRKLSNPLPQPFCKHPLCASTEGGAWDCRMSHVAHFLFFMFVRKHRGQSNQAFALFENTPLPPTNELIFSQALVKQNKTTLSGVVFERGTKPAMFVLFTPKNSDWNEVLGKEGGGRQGGLVVGRSIGMVSAKAPHSLALALPGGARAKPSSFLCSHASAPSTNPGEGKPATQNLRSGWGVSPYSHQNLNCGDCYFWLTDTQAISHILKGFDSSQIMASNLIRPNEQTGKINENGNVNCGLCDSVCN